MYCMYVLLILLTLFTFINTSFKLCKSFCIKNCINLEKGANSSKVENTNLKLLKNILYKLVVSLIKNYGLNLYKNSQYEFKTAKSVVFDRRWVLNFLEPEPFYGLVIRVPTKRRLY